MRRRSKYYYIESFVYDKNWFPIRKKYYFYIRFKDFHKELLDIIKNRFSYEHLKSATIVSPPSILFGYAHEILSEAYSEGYLSACNFFDYERN